MRLARGFITASSAPTHALRIANTTIILAPSLHKVSGDSLAVFA
jgi:hypothetical protein